MQAVQMLLSATKCCWMQARGGSNVLHAHNIIITTCTCPLTPPHINHCGSTTDTHHIAHRMDAPAAAAALPPPPPPQQQKQPAAAEQAAVKLEGGVLVAQRPFSRGDVVVCDAPLLHVPQLKPSNPLYKPLQAYFEQHRIPASVVLKLLAFVVADADTQAAVLRAYCPDVAAFADTAVVRQARTFATTLLQHPPVPELAAWAASCDSKGQGGPQAAQRSSAAAASPQRGAAHDLLVRLWLIWVLHGHSFRQGSALFQFSSTLRHTCAPSNTAHRTPAGDISSVVTAVDGGSGDDERQLPAAPAAQPGAASAAPAAAAAAAAAGLHVATADIAHGDVLTTCYLGLGHRRLMATAARQAALRDKFLLQCACHRCTQEVDRARGIPCPACSAGFRAPDRLLAEHVALPGWQLGQPLGEATGSRAADAAAAAGSGCAMDASAGASGSSTATATATATTSSSGGSSQRCGYVYCSMPQLLAGAATPWACDTCGAAFANSTDELWGRQYARTHATVEADMQGWVDRLDQSLDTAPLVREPGVLHARVLGVLRLLGPRHCTSWRLLLLGVELMCGALEEALLRAQVARSKLKRAAAEGAAAAAAGAGVGTPPAAAADAPAAADSCSAAEGVTRTAVWVVRYCRLLWGAVSGAYGQQEAGLTLGYHFTEAAQVLLQVASSPGVLAAPTSAALVDAALQLNALVLPGLRSVMGSQYQPLAALLDGSDAGGGSKGSCGVTAAGVAAAMQQQVQQRAAEAARMRSLLSELRAMDGGGGSGQ